MDFFFFLKKIINKKLALVSVVAEFLKILILLLAGLYVH